MGTRGLRVYRVRGIYYRIFVNSDAYPRGLGKAILNEIPSDPDDLKGLQARLTTLADTDFVCSLDYPED